MGPIMVIDSFFFFFAKQFTKIDKSTHWLEMKTFLMFL